MSDRDELAREIYVSDFWANPVAAANDWDSGIAPVKEVEQAAHTARTLWAAGWRKMPSREELSDFLFTIYDHGTNPNALAEADAILALMDGGSDEQS